jgi:nitrogen fixation NifU-like protein
VSNLYSPAVLDHFKNPRNAGELPGATAEVEVTNPVCGDILQFSVRVQDGRITEARFKTRGCVAAIACASYLTEFVRGKSAAEVCDTTPQQVADGLGGLPPATHHAAELACEALRVVLEKLG